MSRRRHTVGIPAPVAVLDLPVRGPDRDTVAFVLMPKDATRDDLHAMQANLHNTRDGTFPDEMFGLACLRNSTRRLRPHDVARNAAMGRPPSLTESIEVWQVFRVLNGRLNGRLSDSEQLPEAFQRLRPYIPRLQAPSL